MNSEWEIKALDNEITSSLADLIAKREAELAAEKFLIDNNNNKESKDMENNNMDPMAEIQAKVDEAMKHKGIVNFVLEILAEVKKQWNALRTQVMARASRMGKNVNWAKVGWFFFRSLNALFMLFFVAVCGVAAVKCFAAGAFVAGVYFIFCTLIYAALGVVVESLFHV